MKKEEFIELTWKCGYASKSNASSYARRNPKDEYTDDDFIQVFREYNTWDGEHINGLRNVEGLGGGRTTAINHGGGNSDEAQDWTHQKCSYHRSDHWHYTRS